MHSTKLQHGEPYQYVCLNWDIAGSSNLRQDCAPQTAQEVKVAFYDKYWTIAKSRGCLPSARQGDGGQFLFLRTANKDAGDSSVAAALAMYEAVPGINEHFQLPKPLSVRISLDVGEAFHHREPGGIHGVFLDHFLKNERIVGRIGAVTVTNRVHAILSPNMRALFPHSKPCHEVGCSIHATSPWDDPLFRGEVPIQENVARLLWRKAGGRCAFDHKSEVSFPDADEPNECVMRIDSLGTTPPIVRTLSDGQQSRESAELVLLCSACIKDLSGKSLDETAKSLRDRKRRHEEWVRTRLNWTDPQFHQFAPEKLLVVLWGVTSAGKDVLVNRMCHRLGATAIRVQRYTTRDARPEERGVTTFEYCKDKKLERLVASGKVSCVHVANSVQYGVDTHFSTGGAPHGAVALTCMRQFTYFRQLHERATSRGLRVHHVYVHADRETASKRTYTRNTTDQEKRTRIEELETDIEWYKEQLHRGEFDLVVHNSDHHSLANAENQLHDFIVQMRAQLLQRK